MGFLNMISLIGIFGLCAIAWLFSEDRNPKHFPWRVVAVGLLLQFVIGALVFIVPGIRELLQAASGLLNVVFDAADAGARFVFGRVLVPPTGQESFLLTPLTPGIESCAADSIGQVVPGFCGIQLGYIFAFRVLPTVIFLSGLVALFYKLGAIQKLIHLFAKVFHRLMHLSGAESFSSTVNILVGIEAAIAIKPYLAKLTRSELCTILACCFGTATSATIPSYVSILRPVFPNVLEHLVAASILAIPASILLSKILVPETGTPLTIWNMPHEKELANSTSSDASEEILYAKTAFRQLNWMEAAILGALDGIKIALSIIGVVILTLGFVYLLYEFMAWLTTLPQPIGGWFRILSLTNILGALSLPFTVLTGISLDWNELWQASLLMGRRVLETAVLPYQTLATTASGVGGQLFKARAVLILTYALAGFAHLAYWGIAVGGAIALAPSRRRDIIGVSWKALLAGILATYMVACFAGLFDGIFGMNALKILGTP
ncbi:MAG: NupC/NupG family nucleoside CNT transporter [Elainellaceae cyanobacterium]